MYRNSDTQEEIEINKDYLNKKFERRIEDTSSKLFEKVSYEFLLFWMLLCFKQFTTARALLHTS